MASKSPNICHTYSSAIIREDRRTSNLPLQEHSRAMHHASSRGHPSASRFLVYVPQVYVPLDNLSDFVYKKLRDVLQEREGATF